MNETILIGLGAIGCLLAGAALGFWLSRIRMHGESARADDVQQQFDDYRREVTQHFSRTAQHFRAIGREYRELYEHMTSCADSLCDREVLDAKLSFAPKAVLESIAEQPQEPSAPRDFVPDEQRADGGPAEAEPPVNNDAADKARKEAQAEPEVPADVGADRTLH